MQLNKLIIETRLRTGWSSIDLGFILARVFWSRAFLLYLLMAVPIFLLTRLISDVSSILPYVILWWCKPLFERPILFFISRELFSQRTNFKQTLFNIREWLMPGIFLVLSVRRLSVLRGMYAPITLLERPVWNQYSQRTSVLGNKFASESMWLTVVLFHIESFLTISALVLFAIMFPEQVEVSLAWFNKLQENSIYIDAASLIVMAAVAPFYTAAGFMLYISRRIELEGWDIEICFRDWMTDYKGRSVGEVGETSA